MGQADNRGNVQGTRSSEHTAYSSQRRAIFHCFWPLCYAHAIGIGSDSKNLPETREAPEDNAMNEENSLVGVSPSQLRDQLANPDAVTFFVTTKYFENTETRVKQ